jgi:hypothetical protein
MTKITSALAAALIASASFAGAALAEGDYYSGAQKSAPAASSSVDTVRTGSIGDRPNSLRLSNGGRDDNRATFLNSGDYYDGISRPN